MTIYIKNNMKVLKPIKDILSFEGKTVLITGSAGGIGEAIAKRFAEAGANLQLLDIDLDKLKESVNNYKDTIVSKISTFKIDLSKKEEIDAFWEELGEENTPDILINNAGIYPNKDYLEVDEKYLDKTLDINMNSMFWMCQNFIRSRIKKGGAIVNLSSIEAILPFKKDLVHYTVSKAGVIALTRSLARDYGRQGFRANVILPGAIKTPGTNFLIKEALTKAKFGLMKTGYDFKQRLANGRWGIPDEIAKVVLFLSSDMASYVQGAVLPVDGGFLTS
jgi:3-oxoacyl-[acyl-carrier protein] reductase